MSSKVSPRVGSCDKNPAVESLSDTKEHEGAEMLQAEARGNQGSRASVEIE